MKTFEEIYQLRESIIKTTKHELETLFESDTEYKKFCMFEKNVRRKKAKIFESIKNKLNKEEIEELDNLITSYAMSICSCIQNTGCYIV